MRFITQADAAEVIYSIAWNIYDEIVLIITIISIFRVLIIRVLNHSLDVSLFAWFLTNRDACSFSLYNRKDM